MKNAYSANTLRYDPEKCIGCRMCSIVCPHGVFVQNDHLASIERPEKCMECGACQRNCPTDAIKVDSGVGCAASWMLAVLKGQKEPSSCCGDDPGCA